MFCIVHTRTISHWIALDQRGGIRVMDELDGINSGLLVARIVLGLLIAGHGAQKLFGWFGGYGLAGTGGFFEGIGFRPGQVFAFFAGLGEAGGGLLMAL